MFNTSDYIDLLQQLEQFFTATAEKKPIANPLDPDVLRRQLQLELSAEGEPLAQLQSYIADYLNYAVKTAHPTYFNQLWGGFNAACFMGDMLTSATNTSMYTYEVAPVATLIEKTLIAKLGGLVGFSDPDGQFTTGGSNGNFMAMAMARHRAAPFLKRQGMVNGHNLVAFGFSGIPLFLCEGGPSIRVGNGPIMASSSGWSGQNGRFGAGFPHCQG